MNEICRLLLLYGASALIEAFSVGWLGPDTPLPPPAPFAPSDHVNPLYISHPPTTYAMDNYTVLLITLLLTLYFYLFFS